MVFPQASETLLWTAFARKVEMVEKWMELIERASTRIVGLYSEPGNLAEEVLTKLLGLSCAFWAWDGHQNCDSATYTPLYMREKTLKVMLIVVRALGDSVTTAPSDRRLWQTLRMFLVECLDVIRDFASGPATLTPSNVKFFKDASLSQSIVSVFEIKLHSPYYFDAFLLSGIEAVSQTLCLPMRSKWFFSDLLRLIPDSTRLLFDFYSSPSCLASPDLRRKLLNRVVMNVIPFYRLHPGFCGPLKALPYRLLQYQLRSPDLQDTEVKVINEAQMVISA
ncbi:Serine/threonine-protein kinase atr, partial [Termitomyces sp. T112]